MVALLENYTMERDSVYGYRQDRGGCSSESYARATERDSYLQPDRDPEEDSALSRRETARLLKRMGAESGPQRTLSDRVFGGQIRRGKVSIENSDRLIAQREELLKRAIREIDARHNDVFNRWCCARRPYSGLTSQEINRIEKTLLDLESDRRDAYLQFWKDVATEQKELLEIAAEYLAAKDRASLLGGASVAYGSLDQSDQEDAEDG